jgi:hypothetical protein
MTVRRPWPLIVLMAVLVAWEPVTFALYASSVVDRIAERGAVAIAVLLGRVIVTAVGIAAGLAIWNNRTWAVPFARVAVVLSAAATLVVALTHALPTSTPPGLRTPLLLATLAWDAAWIVYLTLLKP